MDVDGVRFAGPERSTSAAGRAIVAAAAAPVDGALAARVAAAPQWHRGYLDALPALLRAELAAPTSSWDVPAAGLAAVRDHFVVATADGPDVPLAEVRALPVADPLHTVRLQGRGEPVDGLRVPVDGTDLAGDELLAQLDDWVGRGVVEPDVRGKVAEVVAHPQWLSLPGRTVVVLGGTSEMGPLEPLLSHGARVAVVDLPGGQVWDRLLTMIGAGASTVLVPSSEPDPDELAGHAGIDVLRQLPELLAWVASLPGPLVVGNYVYADGGTFARAAAALDVLAEHLLATRDDIALALLMTPTDTFLAPAEAVAHARARLERSPPLTRAARAVSRGRGYVPAYDEIHDLPNGRTVGIADGLVPQQGPNYALAKHIQRWRVRAARGRGVRVSANVAPATRTRSVTSNRLLAAAYDGASRFAIEVFAPETSRALMAALLVADLCSDGGVDDPGSDLAHRTSCSSTGRHTAGSGGPRGGRVRCSRSPRCAGSCRAELRGWRRVRRAGPRTSAPVRARGRA